MKTARGSDIICFPETSLTGSTRLKYSEVNELVKTIGKESKLFNLWVIFGGYCKRGNKTYNEVYVLDRKGKLVYTYKKRHLWNTEKRVDVGRKNRAVRTDFGKIGVINCWDIAFPDSARKLAKRGAQIIFCPSYWYWQKDSQKELRKNYYGLVNARAFENQVYFVMCDAFSPETSGTTRICSPVREISRSKGEKLITAEISLNKLKSLRKRYDCWK